MSLQTPPQLDREGFAPPPPGGAYPQILRGATYSVGRSLFSALTGLMTWWFLGAMVGLGVLALAWKVGHQELGWQDFYRRAVGFEYWEGMLSAHLSLILLIPISFLLVRYAHLVRPGYLWSVAGGPRWRYLLACLLVAVVVFAVYVGTMPLRGMPLTFNPQPGFWAFLVVVLLTSPLQAAAEEFFFRGYLMQSLGSLVRSPWFGVVVSALVFALFHGTQNLPLFLSRFAFGLLAAWLVLRTGGLEAAIAAHVVNNLFAFILAGLTSSMAQARQTTVVGWGTAFTDVINFAVFAVLAALVAVRMAVWTRVPGGVPQSGDQGRSGLA